MTQPDSIPAVSVTYAQDGSSTRANSLGMRPMQERAYQKRGEQFLLIKSPPASGKSRALMFIALDKLANQGIKQAIIVVPERSIGASFQDEPLSDHGFFADWKVEPRWNLCDAAGSDNGSKVEAVKAFLESDDKALVCTHATFRFAMDRFGPEVFDDRLIVVDEFHHISEVVATFKLSNINRKRLEALLHKFFNAARLDLELNDRFGFEVTPREWFLVPFTVIEEAIQKLTEGTIGDYRYDPGSASLQKI